MQEKIWKIQASYTVEASYIRSMVILSLAVLNRAAYGQYLDKTSLFLMNYAVERLYGQEENKSEALQYGSVSGNAVRTKIQVTGTIRGQDHMRSIQKRVHEPDCPLSGWKTHTPSVCRNSFRHTGRIRPAHRVRSSVRTLPGS